MAKKRAWITFEEMNGHEGISIRINTDGEWEIDRWFPCVAKIGADEVGAEGDTDYVHWTIFRRLAHLSSIGYEIEFDW